MQEQERAARPQKTYSFGKDSKEPSRLPVKSFRSGAIQVAIWENEGTSRDGTPETYKTVSFERRYKDKSGEWKSTNQLRTADLPKATLILHKAYEYLVLTQSQDDEIY